MERKALAQGDLVLSEDGREAGVRRNGRGITLVMPKSGKPHASKPYGLAKGHKVRVIGRLVGGWTGLADDRPKTPKASKPAAPKPPKAETQPKAAEPTTTPQAAKQPPASTNDLADLLDTVAALGEQQVTLVRMVASRLRG